MAVQLVAGHESPAAAPTATPSARRRRHPHAHPDATVHRRVVAAPAAAAVRQAVAAGRRRLVQRRRAGETGGRGHPAGGQHGRHGRAAGQGALWQFGATEGDAAKTQRGEDYRLLDGY